MLRDKKGKCYWKCLNGQAFNRKLLNNNFKLYISLLKIKDDLKDLGVKNVNLSAVITFLIMHNGKIKNIICRRCGGVYKYNCNKKEFVRCKCIQPAYPSVNFFKFKYKYNWLEEYEKYKIKRKIIDKKRIKNNLEGFIKRCDGDVLKAKENYHKYWQNNFKNRKNVPFSIISQNLFWQIYENLSPIQKKLVKFAEKGGELCLNLNDHESYLINNKTAMFVDFNLKEKIIEFDGEYWHLNREDNDNKRDEILRSRGFNVFHIKEKEYRNNPDSILEQCMRFLNGDN